MTISPEFLDELRARLSLAEIVGRKVKLRRQGREHAGLCPFHNEKTPSFTVSEDKQFYHCFGCGAHGDAIRFVTETEGLSFPEAVEKLAGQAGLVAPPSSPAERAREQKRASLADVVEIASDWFESQLATAQGGRARDYLARRGLDPATIRKFRIGFAPDRRTALKSALSARDVSERQLIEAGLLIAPDEGGESYDRFRNRIMFPIADRRGRIVAFGGRTLGEARAKYLNSPETALFTKGRLLYNLHGARAVSRNAGTVIAVEGYMDVIALAQAGFEHAVAPLGTAITEHQLHELWRLAAEPVLCFDGDKAGLQAGYRALERALALLKPGHSLRFAFLPPDEDPDSLIAKQGARAFAQVIEAALPLSEVLWRSQIEGAALDTPERRAGFQAGLEALVARIGDPKVRTFYRTDMARRLANLFGPQAGQEWRPPRAGGGWNRRRRGSFKPEVAPGLRPETRRKQLGPAPAGSPGRRERLLVLAVINHPWLIERHMEQFSAVEFEAAELDKMRSEIIGFAADHVDLDSETLKRHLQDQGFKGLIDALASQGALAGDRFVEIDAEPGDTEKGWMQLVNLQGRAGLEAEREAAEQAFGEDPDEDNWKRLKAARAALDAAAGGEADI